MQLRPSPVKEAALKAGLEVLQPTSARTEELQTQLAQLQADAAVVVAYGKILPAALLGVTPKGFVNVHFSLLPAYRGAAPIQRALMDGVGETGVSIMVLTEGMDEGPVLASFRTEVEPDETAGELGDRLAREGARLLAETLPRYLSGDILPEPQDHEAATYAAKITSEDARIDWSRSARSIADLVRALNPDPVAWTTFREGRVRILAAQVHQDGSALAPGELAAPGELLIGTGDGVLRLVRLQMPGKKPIDGVEVARGLRLEQGDRFQ